VITIKLLDEEGVDRRKKALIPQPGKGKREYQSDGKQLDQQWTSIEATYQSVRYWDLSAREQYKGTWRFLQGARTVRRIKGAMSRDWGEKNIERGANEKEQKQSGPLGCNGQSDIEGICATRYSE
jgi:hypothetical protein